MLTICLLQPGQVPLMDEPVTPSSLFPCGVGKAGQGQVPACLVLSTQYLSSTLAAPISAQHRWGRGEGMLSDL